ncbi:hypothetical protein LG290_15495 [Halomonas sediminis]
MPSRSIQPNQWTSQEKFQVVLETAPMNKAELSAYCRELHRKDKALAETAALLTLSKKGRGDLRYDPRRGRLASLPDCQRIVTWMQDAQRDGARLVKACQVMGINVRTHYR